MESKIALVTGGTRGIGLACAKKLAQDGYYVLLNFSKNKENADKALEELKQFGNGELLRADLSSSEETKFMFYYIEDTFKKLDVLVNNAGLTKDVSIFNLNPMQDIDNVLNVNAKGPIACIHYAAKLMFPQKSGSIINISSVSASFGNPGQIIYSASKGAVNSITLTAAKELAPFGIRVNGVAPGFIETDMIKTIPEAKLKRYLSNIPTGKMGNVEDVANAVSFLVSDNSKYIIGQTLVIDGGLSL